METITHNQVTSPEQTPEAIYLHAVDLYTKGNKSLADIKSTLIEQGIEPESASTAVNHLEQQIFEAQDKAKKESASNDMLFGGLWFIGGLVVTLSGIGLIAWGAILFGAIQFVRGASNYW